MNPSSSSNPDATVAKAVRLLESPEWSDKAAGLSVLTGRRSSEILSQIEKVLKERARNSLTSIKNTSSIQSNTTSGIGENAKS